MSSWNTNNYGIPSGWTVQDAYETQPLTFEILEDGNVSWTVGYDDPENPLHKTVQYSLNNGDWTNITSTEAGVSISVQNGDIIRFRGNNNNYGNGNGEGCYFVTTCKFNAYGNMMSLINSANYTTIKTLTSNNRDCFESLFRNCSNLKDATNLILPATTLVMECYKGMF